MAKGNYLVYLSVVPEADLLGDILMTINVLKLADTTAAKKNMTVYHQRHFQAVFFNENIFINDLNLNKLICWGCFQ